MPDRPPPGSSIEPPPPMSTTSLPVGARRSASKMPVKPPVLASDILREDLAPRAPARTLIRVWLGTFAAACVLSAVAARFGFGPHTTNVFEGSVAAAAIAAMGVAVPLPYVGRATLAVLAGLSVLILGALDRGPLAPLAQGGTLAAAAGLLAVATLPASLFFRARYRAFPAARVILSVALVASVPAIVLGVRGALDAGAPLPLRILDGLGAASMLTGLFGYMGPETSAGCARWAALVLSVHGIRVAAHALPATLALVLPDSPIDPSAVDAYGRWGFLVGAAGTLASTTLVAIGLYQVLAALSAEKARTVDVHRTAVRSLPPEREDREPD